MKTPPRLLSCAVLASAALSAPSWSQLPNCVEKFDFTCPNNAPNCGATFTSSLVGDTCTTAFLGSCYSSGTKAYRVSAGQTVSIALSGDLFALDTFFSRSGTGAGVMRFLDVGGAEVGTPMTPNGPCGGVVMPPMQQRCFTTAVRSILVTHTGAGGFLWIDDFEVNPFPSSSTVRNGTGINDLCFSELTPLVLGTNWQLSVDSSAHAGATFTAVLIHCAPATGPVLVGGEVLVGGARVLTDIAIPVAGFSVHTFGIPNDLAFVGIPVFNQAVIFGSGWEACNAVDAVVGCY